MIREIIHIARSAWNHEYTSRGPFRALARFARLQLASRIIRQPIAMPFAGGTCLLMRHGARGANVNYYFGLAEFRDMAFCVHYLRSGDLFVDVGANVGAYSILASGVARARSIAFEPVPSTALEFRRNLAVNSLDRIVELHTAAISDFEGTTAFSTQLGTNNSIVLPADVRPSSIQVEVTTLDRELSIAPNLVKIDTEGFDVQCLRGAKQLIESRSRLAMLVEFGPAATGPSIEDTITWLKENEFRICDYDPWKRELSEVELAARRTCNVLLVRGIEDARRRIASAPRFEFGDGDLI
jgi:FkbM family methyltransferase